MTRDTMIETLTSRGGISIADAELVLGHYRKVRVVTQNAHDGYRVTHGAFFDRPVIRRALSAARREQNRGLIG